MLKSQDFNSIKEHSPKVIKLSYDFLVTMQEKNNKKDIEIITMIGQLPKIGETRIKNGF